VDSRHELPGDAVTESGNVKLVRALADAWNRGEPIDPAAYFHQDVEFVPLRAATEGTYRGLTGIERFITDTREVFERFEIRAEYAELGDRVLAWGTVHVRARGSGIETDIPTGGIYSFRAGKIVRWEDFGSREKAFASARSPS
jgi:ketosteroid isomerase-like protein